MARNTDWIVVGLEDNPDVMWFVRTHRYMKFVTHMGWDQTKVIVDMVPLQVRLWLANNITADTDWYVM